MTPGLTVGKIAGVPIRITWTAPLGAFIFTGFRFAPVAWVSFFGLVLIHEVGHALVVRRYRAAPTLIELTGFGGLCHWRGTVSAIGRAAIAWGGIWAQMVVLGLASTWLYFVGAPRGAELNDVLYTATTSNAWLIAVNLIPLAPLDGAEAWRLPILLGRYFRREAPVVASVEVPSDDAFESGDRRDEVKALVTAMFDDARKEPDA